ncbi:hypothetical protein MSG28_013706 [Choristoneura fumiferana]|uniref:Uncharacterized protein n=1 Tax=Choristoneura fumiferana TaxID=7141 RepID=A0ACC0K8I8_CHOFU|nr:hypothetical protein MSG28_013706 [Choristoneura fumiferana]
MTEQAKFEGNSDPLLSNTGVMPGGNIPTFRNPIPSTSFANSTLGPPVLPPRPDMSIQPSYSMTPGYSFGGMGGMGSYGMGGMGSYGNYGGFGGYGGGYGMGGMGGMGGMAPYGGYNRYGPVYGDIESRFIQVAEESSRPAFDSIQSLVNAVGSVAMMLENTFFALTSSFRAILVALLITVGGEKSSSGDRIPKDEALAGLPLGGRSREWMLGEAFVQQWTSSG